MDKITTDLYINQSENYNYYEHLARFIEVLEVEKSASSNTISAYRNDMNDLITYFIEQKIFLKDIDAKKLRKYIVFIQEKRHLSISSISRKVSAIKNFFSFLTKDGIISNNPSIELETPKKGKQLPKPISEHQIELLLEAAYEDINSIDGIRNLAMLEILYATGIRVSELVTLKMSSISQANSMQKIFIKGKGNNERMVLLGDNAITALNNYLKSREEFLKNRKDKCEQKNLEEKNIKKNHEIKKEEIKKDEKIDWLFPSLEQSGKITHITRQRFGQILKKLAISKKIPLKLVSPHKIRHSFASHMLKNGANLRIIQTLLGHSSINSTQIYTKVPNTEIEAAILETHPLSKIKKSKKKID